MTDVPRATRIAHIGIAVRALDEILPFYRDLLERADGDSDVGNARRTGNVGHVSALVKEGRRR